MTPSSDGGGSAAPERTPDARAVVIVAESIPPKAPPPLVRRQLCGVRNIEPNDEIRQRPAVLSSPSLFAIGW